jgi:hypothetical protein
MKSKKILFVCGSLNQTKMLFQISEYLKDYDCYFTPMYTDGFLEILRILKMLEFTPLGGKHKQNTESFLSEMKVKMDYKGKNNKYDLVFLSSDLIVQNNLKSYKKVLVQEGMTDPENLMYYLVKYLKLPRYLASTSTTGLSDEYDYFCVASEGYKELFISKGVNQEKILVTGIPNYDNLNHYRTNELDLKDFVLVATSDARETLKLENRKAFIKEAVRIANGKLLVFKLHPNENYKRAIREINKYAPGSVIKTDCDINYLIANCSTLITKYSTVVYTGIALGKKVYSYFDIDALNKLCPIQNNGTSAEKIAEAGIKLLENETQKSFTGDNITKRYDDNFEIIFNYK